MSVPIGKVRARAGDVFENPVTGEHCVVLEGPEENGGDRYLVLMTVQPGGAVVGEHFHSYISETFTVLEGELGVRLDGAEDVGGKGDRFEATVGVHHDWWNAGAGEAKVLLEITPAGRFGDMITTLFALARDGLTDKTGRPKILQASLLAPEFDPEIRFTNPPFFIQRALFAVLAPIARARGYEAMRDYGDPANIGAEELAALDAKYEIGVRPAS